jgi:hypothetical protein
MDEKPLFWDSRSEVLSVGLIFIDTQDYQNFLEWLGNILTDSSNSRYV